MSLLAKLKSGKKNIKAINFPGTEKPAALQVLSNQDFQDAVFAAELKFKSSDIAVTPSTLDAYEDERTTQVLFRALRDPDDPSKSFAGSVDELRKLVSKEEKEILVDEYNSFERESSPRFSQLSEEEFEKLWSDVKKSPQMFSSSLSSGTLRGLINYLACRHVSSQTDNGSTS